MAYAVFDGNNVCVGLSEVGTVVATAGNVGQRWNGSAWVASGYPVARYGSVDAFDNLASFQAAGGAAAYGDGPLWIGGVQYWSDGSSISAVNESSASKPILPDVYIKSINQKIYPPNPYAGIGNGEITHPCIIYSANKFGGYFYWMAYTPYPSGDSAYENPVLCASNDLINWVSPVVNPLVSKPSGGYNADTTLAFNQNESVLYLIYRERTSGSNYLKLMHSANGVSWSTPVSIKTGTTAGGQDFASPSIWYNPIISKWECIYHNLDSATNPKPVEKITSTNADPYSAWGSPTQLSITPTSGNFFWHSHFVRLENGAIVGVITENVIGSGGSSGVTFLAYSNDFSVFIVKPTNFPVKTYRPSLMVDSDGSHKVIISNNVWDYFVICGLYDIAEYTDYLANNTLKMSGSRFVLAKDTFDRADSATTLGNSESGTPWTILSGTGGISANKAYNPGGVNLRAVIATTTPDVEVSFKLDSAAASGSYIVMRALNTSNYIRFGVLNTTNQSMVLQTVEAGSIVVNKTYPLVIDYAAKPVFKAIAKDSIIQLYLNDCLFAEEELDVFKTNTLHGFQLSGASGLIDSFLLEPAK